MSNYCQCTTKLGARCKNTVKIGQFCHVHKKCTNPYPGASAPSDRSQVPSGISQAPSNLSQAPSNLSQAPSDLSQAPSDLSQATTYVPEVLEFLEMPDVNKTSFRGIPLNEYAGILHFLKKYPNACLAGLKLKWNESDQRIKTDTNNILNFENCLKNHNVRFIIGLIKRQGDEGEGSHANSYLYDKEDNSLEIFEPHGVNISPTTPRYQKDMRDHFSKLGIENIYFSDDFCPLNSFQGIQSRETGTKIGDPRGFCAAWSLWWLNYRLANANSKKNRKQLADLALEKLQSTGSLTRFIRNYAQSIVEIRNELIQKLDKTITEPIIKKYHAADDRIEELHNFLLARLHRGLPEAARTESKNNVNDDEYDYVLDSMNELEEMKEKIEIYIENSIMLALHKEIGVLNVSTPDERKEKSLRKFLKKDLPDVPGH